MTLPKSLLAIFVLFLVLGAIRGAHAEPSQIELPEMRIKGDSPAQSVELPEMRVVGQSVKHKRAEVSALLTAYFKTLKAQEPAPCDRIQSVSPEEAGRAVAVLRAYLDESQ